MTISIGVIEKAIGKGKFIYMSVAQQLREEGKEEGSQEAAKEIAKNLLLKLRWDIDKVQVATGLPKIELEQMLLA